MVKCIFYRDKQTSNIWQSYCARLKKESCKFRYLPSLKIPVSPFFSSFFLWFDIWTVLKYVLMSSAHMHVFVWICFHRCENDSFMTVFCHSKQPKLEKGVWINKRIFYSEVPVMGFLWTSSCHDIKHTHIDISVSTVKCEQLT